MDNYVRFPTTARDSTPPTSAGGATVPLLIVRVPLAAGAGTAQDDTFVVPAKMRLVDVKAHVITVVSSSVLQVFTASGGGGSAASSSLATSAAGQIRDNLTTASQVFADGATIYMRRSAGATLAGVDVYLYLTPET